MSVYLSLVFFSWQKKGIHYISEQQVLRRLSQTMLCSLQGYVCLPISLLTSDFCLNLFCMKITFTQILTVWYIWRSAVEPRSNFKAWKTVAWGWFCLHGSMEKPENILRHLLIHFVICVLIKIGSWTYSYFYFPLSHEVMIRKSAKLFAKRKNSLLIITCNFFVAHIFRKTILYTCSYIFYQHHVNKT